MKTLLTTTTLALAFSTIALAAPPKAPKRTPELEAKGNATFAIQCVACHGEKGDGTGPAAIALNPKPRNFSVDPFKNGDKPEQVFKTITEGIPGTGMAPFAHLSEEERWSLAFHVVSLRPAPAKPAKKGKTK